MHNTRLTLTIGLMTALFLCGCAKVQYPSFYVLSPPAPAPAAHRAEPVLGSVAVREFDAPVFLKGGPIAYRESSEQLGFYDYHRWAVDPRRAVTSSVIQAMESRTIFRSVDLFDGRENSDCLMTGAIDHLEEVDRGSSVSIEVGLSARLIDVRTGEVLWRGAASKTEKLDRRSVPGVVAAMSREVGNVTDVLVSSMQDHLMAGSASKSRPSAKQ